MSSRAWVAGRWTLAVSIACNSSSAPPAPTTASPSTSAARPSTSTATPPTSGGCADCSFPGTRCVAGSCQFDPDALFSVRAKTVIVPPKRLDAPPRAVCIRGPGGEVCSPSEPPLVALDAWNPEVGGRFEVKGAPSVVLAAKDLSGAYGLEINASSGGDLFMPVPRSFVPTKALFADGLHYASNEVEYVLAIEPAPANARRHEHFVDVAHDPARSQAACVAPGKEARVAEVAAEVHKTLRDHARYTRKHTPAMSTNGFGSNIYSFADGGRVRRLVRVLPFTPPVSHHEFFFDAQGKLIFLYRHDYMAVREDGSMEPHADIARLYYDGAAVIRVDAPPRPDQPKCAASAEDLAYADMLLEATASQGEARLDREF